MSSTNKNAKEPYETTPDPSIWDTREGMMSEQEVRQRSEERGKGQEGKVRADQSGEGGPQDGGDPAQRADDEGGVAGRLKRKNAEEYEGTEQQNAKDWQKYDWA